MPSTIEKQVLVGVQDMPEKVCAFAIQVGRLKDVTFSVPLKPQYESGSEIASVLRAYLTLNVSPTLPKGSFAFPSDSERRLL